MKSYDVIRQAVEEPGVKAVAAALKVSPALVYKWCEPPADSDDPDQSGAKNPLDRVREMYLLTKDIRLVRWLCNEAGGFFVANPVPGTAQAACEESIFVETRSMVREFSELLDAVTESVENDPGIDPNEADTIRQKWEDLKACVERFVIGCEKGQLSHSGGNDECRRMNDEGGRRSARSAVAVAPLPSSSFRIHPSSLLFQALPPCVR